MGETTVRVAPTDRRWLDRGVGRLVRVGIVAVPVVVLAVQGYRFRWITDDGFIYFRVVETSSRRGTVRCSTRASGSRSSPARCGCRC